MSLEFDARNLLVYVKAGNEKRPVDPLDLHEALKNWWSAGYLLKGYVIEPAGEKMVRITFADTQKKVELALSDEEIRKIASFAKRVSALKDEELRKFIDEVVKHMKKTGTLKFAIEDLKIWEKGGKEVPTMIRRDREKLKFILLIRKLNEALREELPGFTVLYTEESPGMVVARIVPKSVDSETLTRYLEEVDAGNVDAEKVTGLTIFVFEHGCVKDYRASVRRFAEKVRKAFYETHLKRGRKAGSNPVRA